MKKEEIPQDHSALEKFTKEVCYAVDDSGNYTVGLSTGWQVKADALGITWEEAQERVAQARQKVEKGEASPLLFFIELNMMDISLVASYTGFWQWTVKRHLKPSVFKNLSEEKLQKYAEVFDVSVESLKKMKPE
ncbi:MAG: hypothetical protein IPP77_01380 [Bacteroidetes bacterium]|nr:hypothetical protein [Bacteroidota bacterium]